MGLASCIFCIVLFFLLGFYRNYTIKYPYLREGKASYKDTSPAQVSPVSHSIRSDLLIPAENSLLNRSYIIAQIDSRFKKQVQEIQTIALVGPGGSGKTTLARQYAHQQKANIIWEINAETKESLKGSFENLAQALAIREKDKKLLQEIENIKNISKREAKITSFVKSFLRSHSDWVLIFDNVEKFSDVQKYFPQDFATWGQGKIILTTRDSNIENNSHVNSILPIKELSSSQKLTLFTKIRDHKNKPPLTLLQIEKTKIFLENIPPFPLDVSIAAYYLNSTNVTYEKYLENLKNYNDEFTDFQENILKEAGSYTKTRYAIITLSLECIIASHKDFRDLLLFISLLDSQDIPRDLLDKFKSSTVVDNFIYTLKTHSLITDGSFHNLSTLSMHRSIQTIALAYFIKILNLEKNKKFTDPIGTTFKNYAVEAIDKEDFLKMNLLIRHCEIFLIHKNLLTNFFIASIGGELGNIYRELGNYEKARQFLEESVVSYRKNSYENHLWFARSLEWLGNVYKELGNHEKAKQLLKESLVIYKKNSFETHHWFSRSLGCLGGIYRDLGNYGKAKKLYEESLVIYKKNSYENHPWFAWTLGCLGNVYRDLGNYEKAKQLYEESLVIYKKNSFETHPWFARTLGCLGNAYREQGNYEKAKQLYKESLIIYKKNSYENHPWFARALQGLGNVYRDVGNYEKAKKILEESLVIYKKNSFENHSWFALLLGSLGSVYREQGNYEKAKQLFEESLVLYKKNSFENHSWFAWNLGRLGCVYRDLGNYEKAKQLLEKSLVIYKKNLQQDHPWLATSLAWLGSVYREQGNYEKAKQLLEESIIIYKKNSYERHLWFSWALGYLGNVYKDLDNHKKAKNLLEWSLKIHEKTYGKNHANTATVIMNLGILSMLESNMKTAEELINIALKIFQSNKHPRAYKCLESLSALYLKKSMKSAHRQPIKDAQNFKTKAINALKQALKIVKTYFPIDSPHRTRIELKIKDLEQD